MYMLYNIILISIPFGVNCETNDAEFKVPSIKTLNFAYLFSGRFNNVDQVQDDVANDDEIIHDGVDLILKPVDIIALRPAVTFHVAQYLNGKAIRYGILTVHEDDTGSIIIKGYLFQQNITRSEISSIQMNDIKEQVGCGAKLTMISNNVFVGTWPACTADIDQTSQSYTVVVTCSAVTVSPTASDEFPEVISDVPYVNYVKRRYPLPDSFLARAVNFQPPCSN